MTLTPRWHRAEALPARADGSRAPHIAALPAGLPTAWELFEFMRDAELRFATLRLRIVERAHTSRGEESTNIDVVIRHGGHSKVTSTLGEGARSDYEIWISDGDLVRT